MTADELRALGPTLSLAVANKVLGVADSTGYACAKVGAYPVALLRVGKRYRVVTEDLIRLLQLDNAA